MLNVTQLKSNVKSVEVPISYELIRKLEDLYQSEIKKLNLPW